MVSWFYYQRWKDRPDDQNPPHLCDKSPKWKRFCEDYYNLRQNDLKKSEKWYNLTFDECVSQKYPECTYNEGNGYLLEKNMLFDFRSQMMFFCGNTLECSHFNSRSVLGMTSNFNRSISDRNYYLKFLLRFLPK